MLKFLFLIHRKNCHNGSNGRKNGRYKKCNLPRAVRPRADDFAGAGVDQDAVGLIAVAVDGQPDGQQDVFERDADMLRLHKFRR